MTEETKPAVPLRDEYPSNSLKDREKSKLTESVKQPEERQKLDSVAKGTVRPPSLAKKTRSAMFANDAKEVGSYIFWDLVIPALKQTISDVVTGGVERALFGESAGRRSGRTRYTSYSSRVSYNTTRRGEYDSPTEPARRLSARARNTFDFSEILLEDRVECVEVIERLRDILDRYDQATVADLYDLCGISTKYTDQYWGWSRPEHLRDATYRRVRDGYVLQIPEPMELRR